MARFDEQELRYKELEQSNKELKEQNERIMETLKSLREKENLNMMATAQIINCMDKEKPQQVENVQNVQLGQNQSQIYEQKQPLPQVKNGNFMTMQQFQANQSNFSQNFGSFQQQSTEFGSVSQGMTQN